MEQNAQDKKGFKEVAKSAAKIALVPPISILGVGGVVDRHKRIVGAIKNAYKIPKPIPVEERKSFEWWVQHFGLTQEQVRDRGRQYLIEARFCYLFGLIAFSLGISYSFDGHFMGLLSGIAAASICFTAGWTRMFRHFQIERRELCDFEVYVKSPEGWIA